MLFNFYSNLLIASSPKYRDEHAKVEALRLKSTYAFKDYRQALTYYNISKLFRIISIIREADARSKGIGAQQNPYDTFRYCMPKGAHFPLSQFLEPARILCRDYLKAVFE